MSDVDWDADDFDPVLTEQPTKIIPVVTDKWEGEDEEEDVKAKWDEEDNDAKKASQPGSAVFIRKKKKKLADIVAEKEKRKQEELERRQREKDEAKKNMTTEEKLAEKLRIQKIQEDSDLQIASDLLGVDKPEEATPLDEYDLSTSENLNAFRQALLKKIQNTERLEKRPFYIIFLEDLCRGLCENLDMEDIKRVTTVLNTLYNEKVKAAKPVKGKKKGASKAKLNPGQGAITDDISENRYDYDYDDFI